MLAQLGDTATSQAAEARWRLQAQHIAAQSRRAGACREAKADGDRARCDGGPTDGCSRLPACSGVAGVFDAPNATLCTAADGDAAGHPETFPWDEATSSHVFHFAPLLIFRRQQRRLSCAPACSSRSRWRRSGAGAERRARAGGRPHSPSGGPPDKKSRPGSGGPVPGRPGYPVRCAPLRMRRTCDAARLRWLRRAFCKETRIIGRTKEGLAHALTRCARHSRRADARGAQRRVLPPACGDGRPQAAASVARHV